MADKHQTFNSLLTPSHVAFLKLFKLTVSDPNRSPETHQVRETEVKSCIMDNCKQSQLALPGSHVKRCREGGSSDELHHGLEKKIKGDDCLKSNLTKSKSKSMMSIDRKKAQVSKVEFEVSNSKVKVPLPNMVGNQRRQTSVFNGRSNVAHSRSVIDRQKIAGNKSSGSGKAKRPAWDLKGRLDDMELLFKKTNKRIMDLESEKHTLQSDVDMKKEVVAQSSGEIKRLRFATKVNQCNIGTASKKVGK